MLASEINDTATSNVLLYPMKNRTLDGVDGVSRLDLEWHTPALPTSSPQTDITIVTSKPKNPDYKVHENTVATKRSRPVNFKLLRVKPGVEVSITLTYQGHIYGDEPVKRCKKHDECTWCKEHKFNQGFCVISKYHRYDLDYKGHPVAILTPLADHLDGDGTAEFSVVFACWNSCDIHVRCGKDMVLHMHILQDGQVKKVEYTVQCCQNLLRDAFKDRKRKLLSHSESTAERSPKAAGASKASSTSRAAVACSKKTIVSSPGPPCSPPTSPVNSSSEKPVDIVVEGLDEERRDLIERLVRTIGGTTYRIPHLMRIKSTEDSSVPDHQTNGSK